nr:hypothetical protein 4 [Balneolaceae bacterium]
MRGIKGRAWDGDRMIYFDTPTIGLGDGKKVDPYIYFKNDTFGDHVKLHEHKDMLFIGLQDKYGQDIYDGDIIRWDGINYQVYYDKEYAQYCLKNDAYSDYFENGNNKQMEVVGNIYENPELISQPGV